MDADELKTIAQHPLFELGAHTNEHTDLSSAGGEEAYRELSESKAALEQLIGKEVLTFAYPSCAYSRHCPEAARRAGYLSAVTCGDLGGWQRHELQRELVHSRDRSLSFGLKIRGLYRPLYYSGAGRSLRWATRPLRAPFRA
jgi:peptidoglycan/xylan/chitin deacetylase (PgdA/CDA1 family)